MAISELSLAKESRTRSDDSDYLSRNILEVAFRIIMLVLVADGCKAIVFPNEFLEELVQLSYWETTHGVLLLLE